MQNMFVQLIGHLCIFLWDVSIQIYCSFLSLVIYILIELQGFLI